jgi:membrane fusion protein (multidrug efflux system)
MKTSHILVSLVALLSMASCVSNHKPQEEKVRHLVTSPIVMDTTILKDYVCQIRSIQHIELRALEKGYLQKIYVDEGQTVKKGQMLFQIMPNIYQAEYQKARADADYADIEYRNTLSLADKKIVAPNELAMIKAKLEGAKADVFMAKTRLDFTEIRAPFDGIIDRFHARDGSLLDEGDLLTNLSDNSKMWVYFNVPEAEYLDYMSSTKGKKLNVSLLMANNQEFDQTGIVETIEADFDNETGNIPFRATFANPDKLLRHGETGSILMRKKLKNALIIPQKATFEILDQKYVYVVDAKKKVHARQITIKTEIPDLYIIQDGLAPGERILLEGIRKVKDGDKIDFAYENPKKVMANLKLYTE